MLSELTDVFTGCTNYRRKWRLMPLYYDRTLLTYRQDLLPPYSTLNTEAAGFPKHQYTSISTRLQDVASKTTVITAVVISTLFLSYGATAQLWRSPPHCWGFLDHTHTHTHTKSAGILWGSDQLVSEATTYKKHNKLERRTNDWNPRSPQSSGCRPTP